MKRKRVSDRVLGVVVQAVADGAWTPEQVAEATGYHKTHVGYALRKGREMGLLRCMKRRPPYGARGKTHLVWDLA